MKILNLINGEKVEVLSEEGKWFVCAESRFHKLSRIISSVSVVENEEVKEPVEKEKPAKKKKKAAKKEG